MSIKKEAPLLLSVTWTSLPGCMAPTTPQLASFPARSRGRCSCWPCRRSSSGSSRVRRCFWPVSPEQWRTSPCLAAAVPAAAASSGSCCCAVAECACFFLVRHQAVLKLLSSCGGGYSVCAAAESDQPVSFGRQETQVTVVLMGEEHPDVPGETLQEQHGKEDVVMLISWAQLPHVGE